MSFLLASRVYSAAELVAKIVDGPPGCLDEFLRSAFHSSRGQIILGPSRGRIIGGRGGDSRPYDGGVGGLLFGGLN